MFYRPFVDRREILTPLLRFFDCQNLLQDIHRLAVELFQRVAVYIQCGAGIGVSKSSGYRTDINAVCDEERCHSMAEPVQRKTE